MRDLIKRYGAKELARMTCRDIKGWMIAGGYQDNGNNRRKD